MLGIYRLYRVKLVPDDDFGKMTIYWVFIGCIGEPWYLMMILEKITIYLEFIGCSGVPWYLLMILRK